MKYVPVNCSFYDHFEAAITLKKVVAIRYYDNDGNLQDIMVKPIDLIQKNGEEFLLLEDQTKIRLDHIITFNNEDNPGTACAF